MDLRNWEFSTSGSAVVGADVYVYDATLTHPNGNTALASTTTDSNGMWAFTGLTDTAKDVKVVYNSRPKWYKGMTRFTAGIVLQSESLTPLENALGADVLLNNTANFFDGPSVSLTAGTWELRGKILVQDTAGVANIVGKLWDGTTVKSSDQITIPATNYAVSLNLDGIVTVAATTTWKISARDITSASGKILAATTVGGSGNNASYLHAARRG